MLCLQLNSLVARGLAAVALFGLAGCSRLPDEVDAYAEAAAKPAAAPSTSTSAPVAMVTNVAVEQTAAGRKLFEAGGDEQDSHTQGKRRHRYRSG